MDSSESKLGVVGVRADNLNFSSDFARDWDAPGKRHERYTLYVQLRYAQSSRKRDVSQSGEVAAQYDILSVAPIRPRDNRLDSWDSSFPLAH